MSITPDTKLKRLVDEYPFLIDYLLTRKKVRREHWLSYEITGSNVEVKAW